MRNLITSLKNNVVLCLRTAMLCFTIISSGNIIFAQQTRQTQPVSPKINADNSVTFSFDAPLAKEVYLAGDCFPIVKSARDQMIMKNENGLWTLTVGPLKPNIYSYSFVIDGIRVLDQDNGWIKPGISLTENQFLLPGDEAQPIMELNVPHGEVRIIEYYSSVVSKVRRMHVYFPPNYDKSIDKYPVMYLLHGGGDDDAGWTSIGRANFIMDNLLAQGKIKSMIVVMPSLWTADLPMSTEDRQNNYDNFREMLVKDIIPFVEQNYRALSGSNNRAIIGLSPINSLFLDIFLAYPDKFDYIGFTSNGSNQERLDYYNNKYPGKITDEKNVKRVKFYIYDGKNAMTYSSSSFIADAMKKYGYQSTYYLGEGSHTWQYFRQYVGLFALEIFK